MMFTSISELNTAPKKPRHGEGELFRIITAHGVRFEIYYGYYEEIDRQNPGCEPMEMYPNFIESPTYTADGTPFVTAMQRPCEHFRGEPDEDNTCYQCSHYEKCEELLGVCRCRARRRKNE
ncbi:MAG: hypothetical protein IJD51_01885 [Clostridia bacterium]|nr:hypothetical protein [Clostridia bacterium]